MLNQHTTYNFKTCKICNANGLPTFQTNNGMIYVCPACSLHYLDFLDSYSNIDSAIQTDALTDELADYLETQLQAFASRFDNDIRIIEQYGRLAGKRVLDVGCGSGLFLTKARDLGAEVKGVELHDGRAAYCTSRHDLDISKYPIEHPSWQTSYNTFDIVTLWDVVEHVNFPLATIEAAANLLKPDGILVVGTPARDAFYHRMGVLTYRLSFGRFPTFLNTMYSNLPYGHKQILSTQEMAVLFEKSQLKTVNVDLFHELIFPYEWYLRKLLRSDALVRLTAPLVAVFFKWFRIKNKMIAVGRKHANNPPK